MRQPSRALFFLATALLSLTFLLACGGKGSPTTKGTAGTVTLTLSDPTTCGNVTGGYSHIYVTISDVQLSTNPTAPPGDSSFVDLTPGFVPTQVDLLGAPSQCFLATLGSSLGLQAGTYSQIRVFLAADGTTIAGNHCDTAANCVMFTSDPVTPHAIQLGTETTEGIKVSSIGGGGFTSLNDPVNPQILNLNFDACASVVALSGNQFRFKPVVIAGEVTNPAGSITGQLVDSLTFLPVANGKFTVALEQPDSAGIDRVVMETLTDSQGHFTFCPVIPGFFDVVASGYQTTTLATYAATATLTVQGANPATDLGLIPMTAVTGSPKTAATVLGATNSSTTGGLSATSADVTVSALQLSTISGTTALTIPLLQSLASTVTVPTEPGGACPTNTDCATFNLTLAPANTFVGVFDPLGTVYSQDGGTIAYSVEGTASLPLSGATPDCSPSSLQQSVTNVNPGSNQNITSVPLSFFACQ